MENAYQHLGLSKEELFSMVDHNDLETEKITAPRYSYWSSVFRVFFRKKINFFILTLLGVVILFAYVYPAVTDYDPFVNVMNAEAKHLTPAAAMSKYGFSLKYILGTGASGESTFEAIWNGSRISLSLAFLCAAINMTIGVIVGAVWGFSKKVDAVMMEVYNIIGNVPFILFVAVMVMLFTPSFMTLVFAMTVTGWLGIAYSLRIQVIIIRDREYNLASKCLGTSTFHIATRNILPFLISFIVTLMANSLPGYIGSEAFLSYIGLGISDLTLGKIIYNAQSAMTVPGWEWEFWCPVLLSAFISIILFLVGQGLGDAADPRTHML